MKLFYTPGACSLAPHIVIREASIPVDIVRVDLETKMTEDGGDLVALTGGGSIPVLLLDDGRVLREGPAIMQLLADMAPEAKLVPDWGTFDRYKLQEWLNSLSADLHKTFGPLWSKTTPPEVQHAAKSALASRFAMLDRHVSDRKWLMDRFSAADAYAFTILSWSPFFDIDLARWPNVSRYVARVAERPAVRAALETEGLLVAA